MLSFSRTSALPSSSFTSLTACSVSPYPTYRVERVKGCLNIPVEALNVKDKFARFQSHLHILLRIFVLVNTFRKLHNYTLSILFFLGPFTLYTFHPSFCCLDEKVSLHPEYFILHVKNVSFSRHVNDISFHPLVRSIEILIEP